MKSSLFILAMGISLALSSSVVKADDVSAKAKLDSAQQLWNGRTDLAKIEQALQVLAQAETEAQNSDLKYDIAVLTSRALYFKGTHTVGDANKIAIHDLGYKKAEAARKINPDYADALYFSASNLARWGEANGVIASLGKKKEIVQTLEAIYEKDSRDGKPGENFEFNGADRALGRLYFKLPGFAGGSQEKSLKYLENAFKNGKECVLNIHYYAETLAGGSAADKSQAKIILDELLAKDPNTYNPDRMPETAEEFVGAKKLRAELGN